MKREIIARKEQGVELVYAIVTGILIAVFAGGLILLAVKSEEPLFSNPLSWLILAFGVFFSGVFAYQTVIAYRTPEIIVETDGEALYLPKGKVLKITTVERVEYKRAKSRGYEYDYGNLTIITAEKTFRFLFVEDVVAAQTKLVALMEKVRKE